MSSARVSFPLHVDGHGRTATTISGRAAAEQLIEQLLFTEPGERLNRPMLGGPLSGLLFASLTDELAAATQFQTLSTLQQWLGDVMRIVGVETATTGSELDITVTYQLPGAEPAAVTFTR